MVEPLFNVILPSCGRDSLHEAVESVMNQTYRNFHLYVCFDGPESARSIVPDFVEDNSCGTLWVQSSEFILDKKYDDSGATPRNHAIKNINKCHSKGWITYIDDDDVWLPNHLQVLAETINEHPSIELFKTSGQAFRMKHRHPRSSKKVKKMGEINSDDPMTVSMCHSRRLFELTDGWQKCDNHDHKLFAEMGKHSVALFLGSVTFHYKR